MIIFNYYYNGYDEVDVYSINNGNSTSGANIAVIVGATVGGVFFCIIIMIVICVYCNCCRVYCNCCRDFEEEEEVEVITTTVI
jgi:high-affinity nickel permease